jgi:hypothetical protein
MTSSLISQDSDHVVCSSRLMCDLVVFTLVEYHQVIETDYILTLEQPPYRAFLVVWLLAGIMLYHNHIIQYHP